MPSLFLLVYTAKPNSINAKLFLPIIPIGIVAFVGQPLSKQVYVNFLELIELNLAVKHDSSPGTDILRYIGHERKQRPCY